MNHHQCDIHMHPAAYVHGPVLITYLRDILAVGFWLVIFSLPPTLLDCGFKGGTTAVTRKVRVRGDRSGKITSG